MSTIYWVGISFGLAFWAYMIVLINKAFAKVKYMIPKNEEERKRDAEYSEFVQHHPQELWQRLVLYLFAPLAPFRFTAAMSMCVSLYFYSMFLKLFLDGESMTYYRLI